MARACAVARDDGLAAVDLATPTTSAPSPGARNAARPACSVREGLQTEAQAVAVACHRHRVGARHIAFLLRLGRTSREGRRLTARDHTFAVADLNRR